MKIERNSLIDDLHSHLVRQELNDLRDDDGLELSTGHKKRDEHRQILGLKVSESFRDVTAQLLLLLQRHLIFEYDSCGFEAS